MSGLPSTIPLENKGRLLGLLLLSWLVGLVLFSPRQSLDVWLRAQAGEGMTWNRLEVGIRAIRIKGLRLLSPPLPPAYEVRELTLSPNFSHLPLLRLSTDYDLALATMRMTGLAWISPGAAEVEWRLRINDLQPLTRVPGWPEGGITGSGAGEGGLTLDPGGGHLNAGQGQLVLNDLSFLGVEIAKLTLKGTVKKPDRVAIRVSGRGNVAVSGTLNIQIDPGRFADGRLTGTLRVQALKGRIRGVAGTVLSGRPVSLVFSGKISNPRWRLQ